ELGAGEVQDLGSVVGVERRLICAGRAVDTVELGLVVSPVGGVEVHVVGVTGNFVDAVGIAVHDANVRRRIRAVIVGCGRGNGGVTHNVVDTVLIEVLRDVGIVEARDARRNHAVGIEVAEVQLLQAGVAGVGVKIHAARSARHPQVGKNF